MAAELRCPVHPRRLFMRIGGPRVVAGNLIEVACDDCRKDMRRNGAQVLRVLHRYNVLGDLVETEVING